MDRPDIQIHSFIRAPREKVWAALTRPELIEAYHPARMRVRALPEGGHELRRPDDGSTFIREPLRALDEGERLELMFEPVWAKVPDEGSPVTFLLSEEPGACKVTLTQENCAAFGIGDNWDRFLSSLKSYLETGKGLHIPPVVN